MKVIISYPFLYYHLYKRYCRNSLTGDSDPSWPIVMLTVLPFPVLVIIVLQLPTMVLGWLRGEGWLLLMMFILYRINAFYFLRNDRWKRLIADFDRLSEVVKTRSSFIADIILYTTFSLFLIWMYLVVK